MIRPAPSRCASGVRADLAARPLALSACGPAARVRGRRPGGVVYGARSRLRRRLCAAHRGSNALPFRCPTSHTDRQRGSAACPPRPREPRGRRIADGPGRRVRRAGHVEDRPDVCEACSSLFRQASRRCRESLVVPSRHPPDHGRGHVTTDTSTPDRRQAESRTSHRNRVIDDADQPRSDDKKSGSKSSRHVSAMHRRSVHAA